MLGRHAPSGYIGAYSIVVHDAVVECISMSAGSGFAYKLVVWQNCDAQGAIVHLIEMGGGRVLDRDGTDWMNNRFVLPRLNLHPERIRLLCTSCVDAEDINRIQKCWERQPMQISWLMDSVSACLPPPCPTMVSASTF